MRKRSLTLNRVYGLFMGQPARGRWVSELWRSRLDYKITDLSISSWPNNSLSGNVSRVWRQRQTNSDIACNSGSEARVIAPKITWILDCKNPRARATALGHSQPPVLAISCPMRIEAWLSTVPCEMARARESRALPAVRLRSLTVVTRLYQYFSHS